MVLRDTSCLDCRIKKNSIDYHRASRGREDGKGNRDLSVADDPEGPLHTQQLLTRSRRRRGRFIRPPARRVVNRRRKLLDVCRPLQTGKASLLQQPTAKSSVSSVAKRSLIW